MNPPSAYRMQIESGNQLQRPNDLCCSCVLIVCRVHLDGRLRCVGHDLSSPVLVIESQRDWSARMPEHRERHSRCSAQRSPIFSPSLIEGEDRGAFVMLMLKVNGSCKMAALRARNESWPERMQGPVIADTIDAWTRWTELAAYAHKHLHSGSRTSSSS